MGYSIDHYGETVKDGVFNFSEIKIYKISDFQNLGCHAVGMRFDYMLCMPRKTR